jgi:transcriptional regulator with XRE-family HTH domain
MKLSDSTTNKGALLAAGRRVLTAIGAWTNLLFDGSAGKRLLEIPISPDGVIPADQDAAYQAARSAGGRVENSIVLSNLALAIDFVATGEWPGTFDELDGADDALTPFRAILTADAMIDSYGTGVVFSADRDALIPVLDALLARILLAKEKSLTLQQVGVLAGLSEKTVRMAAIKKSGNPDLHTHRDGNSTLVRAQEAERWLGLRPSYKPTRIRSDLGALNLAPRTQNQMATLLSSLRQRAGLPLDELALRLNLTAEQAASYARIEEPWWGPDDADASLFDIALLTRIARVLNVERPLEFVRALADIFIPYQIDLQIAKQFGSAFSSEGTL